MRFLDHTHTTRTFCSTPLDEWSERCKDLYLHTTEHSQETDIHVPGEIRNCNSSKLTSVNSRLRRRGRRDRLFGVYIFILHISAVNVATSWAVRMQCWCSWLARGSYPNLPGHRLFWAILWFSLILPGTFC